MMRRLCENGLEGGYGYRPEEVGKLTPDQIFFLLTDKKHLRAGPDRTASMVSLEVAALADADGMIKGRDRDGNPIKAQVLGETLAARLTREQQEAEEASKTPRQRRRGGRRRRKRQRAAKAAQQET